MRRSIVAVVIFAATPALAAGGTVTGKVDATPTKYLEDTVVYLKKVPGSHTPRTFDMDQKGMKFVPRMLIVTVGDTVKFLNHDSVDHNVFSADDGGYNLGMFKGGETRGHAFTKEGVYTQLCSIHPEMLAYIFVGNNPYAATVDKTGKFTIKNVPPGTYQIAVWNPKLKAADQSVTVSAGKPAEINFAIKR